MKLITVFNNASIDKNGSIESDAIPIGEEAPNWKLSLQHIFQSAGSATCTIEVLTSNDGVNFIDNDADVASVLPKATHDIHELDPTFAAYLKIRVTEEDVAAVTGLYGYLAIQ